MSWILAAVVGGAMARDEAAWDAARARAEAAAEARYGAGVEVVELNPYVPAPSFYAADPSVRPRMDGHRPGICLVDINGAPLAGPDGWRALLASPLASDPAALAAGWLWLWRGQPHELRGLSDGPDPAPAPAWEGGAVRFVYADARGVARSVLLTPNPGGDPAADERPWRAP